MKNYLTGLGLENFRVFKEPVFFDFAPITILTGANNSGKSSVMKALLLMNDYANPYQFLDKLDFSDRSNTHNLGTFQNTISNKNNINHFKLYLKYSDVIAITAFDGHRHALEKNYSSFNLILGYKGEGENAKLADIEFNTEKKDHSFFQFLKASIIKDKFEIQLNIFDFFFKMLDSADIDIPWLPVLKSNCLGQISDTSYKELINEYRKNPQSKINQCKLIFDESYLDEKKANPDEDEEYRNYEKFLEKLFDSTKTTLETEIRIASFSELIEKLVEGKLIPDIYDSRDAKVGFEFSSYGEPIDYFFNKHFLTFVNEHFSEVIGFINNYQQLLSNFGYLQSVRANAKRLYKNSSEGTAINELLLELSQIDFKAKDKKANREFICYWLREFGIADDYKINRIEGVASQVLMIRNDKEENLADMGYGVTQVIPIIFKIAILKWEKTILKWKKTILIEEPETNLHPKLQSKLADMLIDAWEKFGVRFIIETHSEYLIRKLQYWVAKKKITPEDTSIYYLYNPEQVPEGRKQVEKIEILEDGRLNNDFGTGFFDEAAKLIGDIWNASNLN